jgi:Calcineurin-like phosphoesterase
MRKWRPTFRCIYVVPEVRGDMRSLEVILDRVLPLRIFKNQEDVLVMLGDYIDGGNDSDKVIDCLINIKEKYKERAIILRGNHEELLLRARYSDHDFNYWVDSGGATTIAAYAKRAKLNTSSYSIKRNRIQDIIPAKHLDFLNSLDYHYMFEDYCFFNGGFNPSKPISENTDGNFVFDYTSSKYLKECIKNKKDPAFLDACIYVGHHNYNDDKPFIHPKYFMLGGAAPSKLVVFELNSMSACAVSRGKSRIYKYNFSIYE